MGTIEDLLDKAGHSKHQKKAGRLQEQLNKYAHNAFLKHYKKSLSKEEQEKFKELSDDEQLEKISEKDFKLSHHAAEDYLTDLASVAIKGISAEWGKDYKKQMKVLQDKDASADKKAEALRQIDHYKGVLKQYNIDLDHVKEQGMRNGFTTNLMTESFKEYGENWLNRTQKSYLDQIHNDDIDKYLKKMTEDEQFKHFNLDLARSRPYEGKRQMVVSHVNAKKAKDRGGIEDFLEQHKDYFAKPKEPSK